MTAKMISKLCKFLVFIMHLIDAMTHTPLAILVFIVYTLHFFLAVSNLC